jgi:hypothetical protein
MAEPNGETQDSTKPKRLFAEADVPEFDECAGGTGLWVWCIEDFGLGKPMILM